MGQHRSSPQRQKKLRSFTRALLEDLEALERMLELGRLESGIRRIGAEQEVFLVDRGMRAAPCALDVLERLREHPRVTTELGLFNLEINLTPRRLAGDCLRRQEQEIVSLLGDVETAARACGASVLLAGILPTIRRQDLSLAAMTPYPRYRELNRAAVEHRGGPFRLKIEGLDQLELVHDNVMCEACNTSFQVHFQVGPSEFAGLYNLAQAITAPVLAAAVNSPVFLQHRLWSETRLALFEQSVDSRSDAQRVRRARPRVVFGDRWVERSVTEIFRDDIARFRVFLPSAIEQSSLEAVARGELPALTALCLHNGTVYRWNRPCYGIYEGAAHLRIEHRVLPSGPTVLDEVANAAFFHGLMSALSKEHEDITRVMSFDDAKTNFHAAARYGLEARLRWLGGESFGAQRLILERLLPLAREGLAAKDIDQADIERYLGTIEQRVASRRTGAAWALDSLAALGQRGKPEQRFRALVVSMDRQSRSGLPVHLWQPAELGVPDDVRDACRSVDQLMTTDLFTVRPDDLIDLAANLMDWEHIRHVPVEDGRGRLVGLLSHRQLLRVLARRARDGGEPLAARDVMIRDPVTVGPQATTREAIRLMRLHHVSCLPVVDERKTLVGIVSERDFIGVTARLLDACLDE